MRAQQVVSLDGADGVRQVEVPEPEAGALVLVDVEYAGVAFPDLLQAKGMYQVRPDPPFVPGFEAAGVVRSAPEGSGLAPGTRVAVLSQGGGAWQEVVAVGEQQVFPLPDNVSTADGAGLLLNHLTCDFALRKRGRAVAGETLLVHGAAGGVGVSALRVGRALGLRTVAVVSDQSKVATAERAGADHVVLADGWKDAVAERLGERAVDIVLDPVGGDRLTDSLRVLGSEGRLLIVGFTAGEIPTVKVNRLLLTNTEVAGVAWAEFVRRNPDYPREQWRGMVPLLESGELTVEPVTEYPFEKLPDALRAIEGRAVRGKIVLAL
jgi:NADPH2:quinone reductase